MTLRTAPLLGLVITMGLSTPSLAQSSGEITLTIAGEAWIVPLSEESDWNGSERRPYIWIDARSLDEDGRENVVVGLSFDALDWTASAPEMTLWRFEDGTLMKRLWAFEESNRGGLQVTLDSHEVEGATLRMTGSLMGMLGPSENRGETIDMSDGVPVSGSFNVTLEALD
ncbi:hypothetical protein [Oceaniglobus indicus]|uniref:hypothetical protein n=1 Tax=Oceaniglobus indicus TaxID=2047749 RepID=UPI000C17A5B6|nr:hypothetical protein [Oceaniglobus indicus]